MVGITHSCGLKDFGGHNELARTDPRPAPLATALLAGGQAPLPPGPGAHSQRSRAAGRQNALEKIVDQPATFIVDSEQKRQACVRTILRLPLGEKVWDITVKQWRPRRSLSQNARLHKIFQLVAQETGGDIESVKLGYKQMFLAGKESIFQGRKQIIYPRTSQMNRKELADFMDAVESHAITEWGLVLGN